MAFRVERGLWFAFAASILVLTLLPAPAAGYPQRTAHDRTFAANGSGPFLLADVTGDGWPDLISFDDVEYKLWLRPGGASGLAREPVANVSAGSIRGFATADLAGQGRTGLLVAGEQEVLWIRWTTAFEATPLPLDPAGGGPLVAADFNDDGRADIAVLGTTGARVWFQQVATELFPTAADRTLSDGIRFDALVAGDATGDGRDDLVLAKPFEMHVYVQGSLGLAPQPILLPTGGFGGDISVRLVDVSSETPLLVAVSAATAGGPGTIAMWQWGGDKFDLLRMLEGPYTARVAVGDVNDDGWPDLAVATVERNISILYQRNGRFTFAVPDLVLDGSAPGDDPHPAIGDANGDQFPDVVVRSRNPDAFFLYLQEDAVPRLIEPIPSTYALNRGSAEKGLIDLRQFFVDDHNRLTFRITHESNPDLVTATVTEGFLDVAAGDAYGFAELRVSAWDGNPTHAPIDSNAFSVLVNDPPVIASAPPLRATAGETYAYVPTVIDAFPSEDAPTFVLLEGPEGMAVDPATGFVRWTPSEDQVGSHGVGLEVRDRFGGVTVQRYVVVVSPSAGLAPVLLLAVGIAATSAAFLAAAALLNENAKWALLLFILPLYTKIKRERVLDHFVRGQIYGYIQANPGEHYNAIKNALGLTNGSLAHHLRTLEREQFVKSKRFGLYRRFYPMHMRLPEDGAFQPNAVQRTILETIRDRPGLTQKEIATGLGLTPPTVNYHISVLSERGVIRVERRGRSTHCFLAEENA